MSHSWRMVSITGAATPQKGVLCMNFDKGITWKKKTGIYMIENYVTGNRYIGSAARCLYTRFHQHKSDLSKHKHSNHYLQNAWNKYGSEAFVFWVIEEHEPEYCAGIEHWWIQMASPEYNLNTNTVTRLGAKVSEETRAKLRNRKVSKETRERIRDARMKQEFTKEVLEQRATSIRAKFNTPIGCSNGKMYTSVEEASTELKIPVPSISRVLTGYTRASSTRHKLNFWYLNGESNSARTKYKKKKG